MATTRTIDRLTEGWPDDPEYFELAAFAVSLRGDRPELSGPALDRVAATMRSALDRRESRAARFKGFRALLRPRRLVPLAAAASVLVTAGVWLRSHPSPGAGRGPVIPPVPVADPSPASASRGVPDPASRPSVY